MKKYIFIILALLGCTGLSQAQQKISLNEAMEYAVKNRYDVQANKIDIDLAENAVSQSRNQWIPEITAAGEMLYNAKLQTMIFDTGEEFQSPLPFRKRRNDHQRHHSEYPAGIPF